VCVCVCVCLVRNAVAAIGHLGGSEPTPYTRHTSMRAWQAILQPLLGPYTYIHLYFMLFYVCMNKCVCACVCLVRNAVATIGHLDGSEPKPHTRHTSPGAWKAIFQPLVASVTSWSSLKLRVVLLNAV
jgi:hypothetical protein